MVFHSVNVHKYSAQVLICFLTKSCFMLAFLSTCVVVSWHAFFFFSLTNEIQHLFIYLVVI